MLIQIIPAILCLNLSLLRYITVVSNSLATKATQWQADWTIKEALAKYEQARGGKGLAKSTHIGGSVSFRTSAERLDQLLLLRQQLGLEEEVDDNQLYYKAVGGHDKRKRVFSIGSLASYVPVEDVRCNSTAPSEIQSTPTDYSVQQQLHTLKEHVDHQKKCAEEEKKRMEEALVTKSQKRIELTNRLEEAMTIIATLQGHGTPSSSHVSG